MTVPISLVGLEDRLALWVVRSEPGSELAAVLQVDQHSRHEAGDVVGVPIGNEG